MIICASGCIIIENPRSSLIFLRDRFQWLLKQLERVGMKVAGLRMDFCWPIFASMSKWWTRHSQLCLATKMYRQALWLGNYKHQSPKRTLPWSTSRAIGCLNLGFLAKTFKTSVATTKRYIDKRGKTRYQGSAALKPTQLLTFIVLVGPE